MRNAGAVRYLPRRVGTGTGLTAVSDPHILDVIRGKARRAQRSASGHGAELRGMHVPERPAVLPDWRPCRADNDNRAIHDRSSLSNDRSKG
jgi:hypothetical protein